MKKIVFTFVLAAFAMTANAQLILGGQIGVGHQGNHDDNYTLGSSATATFALSPKIGYQLSDKWQVGATVMFGFDKERNYAGAKNTYSLKTNLQYGIAPYARYTFGAWNNWSLFVEGQFVFGASPESTTRNIVDGKEIASVKNGDNAVFYRIGVVPGMNYKFSTHFSMDLYLNVAKIGWNVYNTKTRNMHDCVMGVNFNEMSGLDYLDVFGIAFNYSL